MAQLSVRFIPIVESSSLEASKLKEGSALMDNSMRVFCFRASGYSSEWVLRDVILTPDLLNTLEREGRAVVRVPVVTAVKSACCRMYF